ncbi:unnamed protein product, partial [Allacma fusca]
MRTSSTNSCPL